MNFVHLSYDSVTFLKQITTFRLQYCQSSSGDKVDCLRFPICSTLVCCYWCISSLLFRLLNGVPSQVFINRLLCCLIVGIQASGQSILLFLLMLLRWSLIWIASLTLRVYQWGSRSINLILIQIGICPVSLACSGIAEV